VIGHVGAPGNVAIQEGVEFRWRIIFEWRYGRIPVSREVIDLKVLRDESRGGGVLIVVNVKRLEGYAAGKFSTRVLQSDVNISYVKLERLNDLVQNFFPKPPTDAEEVRIGGVLRLKLRRQIIQPRPTGLRGRGRARRREVCLHQHIDLVYNDHDRLRTQGRPRHRNLQVPHRQMLHHERNRQDCREKCIDHIQLGRELRKSHES